MADFTTTTGQISVLFIGPYWARCQLPNSIKDVSVASKLTISLTSVEGTSIVLTVIGVVIFLRVSKYISLVALHFIGQ